MRIRMPLDSGKKDWAGYTDVFTEDFELDTSAAGGPPTIYGREAAMRMIHSAVETARGDHSACNQRAERDSQRLDTPLSSSLPSSAVLRKTIIIRFPPVT
jgi:hypothetical protein